MRTALEVVVPCPEPPRVAREEIGGAAERRLGQDDAVGPGCAEAVSLHQGQPPATASPARSIASRKTSR